MREIFELRSADAAGRIGELEIPRAGVTVETPALMPVINPHIRTIEPATLSSTFGADVLITNGYILYESDDYRERALEEGLHDLLDFPGAIVTDSGSFQLAEYGEISVTTEEILRFQYEIGSDVGTPVDVPTPPDVSRERAESELETTEERLALAETLELGEMLLNAPIQGSTYPDLRRGAAETAYAGDFDIFPVGAVVPLLNDYRYADVLDVVLAAKRGLGLDAPVHLFGAGHPMTFALAAAAGCDLFDSAAYAIYARDGRYLTVSGTEHLEDIEYFPCSCPVCVEQTPAELRSMDEDARERLLAKHNLHVSYEELRTIKAAIREGNLLELVERRARSHPALLDGYRRLLESTEQLERTDPVSKETFFYLSGESARRPEVSRYHDRIERLEISGENVLLSEGGNNDRYDETWRLRPPFGPHPRALSETYPLNAEVPERLDRSAYEAAAEGVRRFVDANPDVSVTVAHHGWPEDVLASLPDAVETYRLGAEESKEGYPGGDEPET